MSISTHPEEKMLQDYSPVSDAEQAQWLLVDGRMVGRPGALHGHIAAYIDPAKSGTIRGEDQCAYQFMQRGNMKLACSPMKYYIEFAAVPTQAQFNTLRTVLRKAVRAKTPVQIVKHRPRYQTKSYTPQEFFEYLHRYTKLKAPGGGIIVYDLEPVQEGFYFALG